MLLLRAERVSSARANVAVSMQKPHTFAPVFSPPGPSFSCRIQSRDAHESCSSMALAMTTVYAQDL